MIQIHPKVWALPSLHGKIEFSRYLREWLQNNNVDCIALELPQGLESQIQHGVEKLPILNGLLLQFDNNYELLPIDPGDAMIEGVRQSLQRRIPFVCIDSNHPCPEPTTPWLPDPYSLRHLSLEEYIDLCRPLKIPKHPNREAHMKKELFRLSQEHDTVLWIGGLAHFFELENGIVPVDSIESSTPPICHPCYLNPKHAYFYLGELPFVVSEWEKTRMNPWLDTPDIPNLIKDLFFHTRSFFEKKNNMFRSPARVQKALDFLAKLVHQKGRITPDLIEIIESGKGVLGDEFAINLLHAAKDYAYIEPLLEEPLLNIKPDSFSHPILGEGEYINRLHDTPLHWENISLKPKIATQKSKQNKYFWNPSQMCSHLPEDLAIERFNQSIRRLAKKKLEDSMTKTEEFQTSLRDGLDIRETIRNWHSGKIYVKENPPALGGLDTVVILFDLTHDKKYPNQMVWSAEHMEESTLCFYGTDPYENLIGPGIAQSTYGGLSLLFPPRPVMDPFRHPATQSLKRNCDKLLYGALQNSISPHIALVSALPPDALQKKIASQFKKHLVWIPLSHFNEETRHKLRVFHILNGQDIRSFATRFIGF